MNDKHSPQEPLQPEAPAQPETPGTPDSAYPQAPQDVPAAQGEAPVGGPQPAAPASGSGFAPQNFAQPTQQNSSLATAALVSGIVGLVLMLPLSFIPFAGLIGLILCIAAISQASRHVKRFGKNGRATAGKVCGITGIVIFVIGFIVSVALGVGIAVGSFADFDPSDFLDKPAASTTEPKQETASEEEPADPEEAAALQAVTTRLDALIAGDEAETKAVAKLFDARLAEEGDLSMTEMGLDTTEYVRWVAESLKYADASPVVYGDAGSVMITVTTHDTYEFVELFGDKAYAYLEEQTPSSLDDATATLNGFFRDAMAETKGTSEHYAFYELEKVDGTWVINEDSWQEELESIFM